MTDPKMFPPALPSQALPNPTLDLLVTSSSGICYGNCLLW